MSTIENNKIFEEFRERCEDKNTLAQKNSLYVGKGTNKTLSNGTKICETEAIAPPNSHSDVLAKDSSEKLSWVDIVDVMKKSSKSVVANETDFTTANWIDVTDEKTGAIGLVEGATYEVMPYITDGLKTQYLNCGIFTLFGRNMYIGLDTTLDEDEKNLVVKCYSTSIQQQDADRIVVARTTSNIGFNSLKNGITISQTNISYLKFKYRRIR